MRQPSPCQNARNPECFSRADTEDLNHKISDFTCDMNEMHTKMDNFQRFILESQSLPSNIPVQQLQNPEYGHINNTSFLNDPAPCSPGESDNSIDQHVPLESAQVNSALNLALPTIQ